MEPEAGGHTGQGGEKTVSVSSHFRDQSCGARGGSSLKVGGNPGAGYKLRVGNNRPGYLWQLGCVNHSPAPSISSCVRRKQSHSSDSLSPVELTTTKQSERGVEGRPRLGSPISGFVPESALS